MAEEELNLVELSDEEGNVTSCEIYDIVEFEGKTYALLLPVESADDEDPELIVLEYVEEDEEGTFVSIEDEDEFSKAQDIFKVTTTDPSYLIEAHKYLKETIPGAELFMFAYTETTLRVVDLNQDPSFKRELKKKGLI